MIDLLKIPIDNVNYAEELYNNKELKTEQKNIKQYYITIFKTYKGIIFKFTFLNNEKQDFKQLEILIKPHYYYNNNLHNANDYNFKNCIQTLKEIKDKLKIPSIAKINNIEFGINAISPIDCKELILDTVYYGRIPFTNSSDNLKYSKLATKHRNNGKTNNYKFPKFYNKGVQFPQHTNINTFRYEIKSKESKYIKTQGIHNYNDLLKHETYNNLGETLKKEFKKILIIDTYNTQRGLTKKEKQKLNNFLTTRKWQKSLNLSRNTFNKHKKEYMRLLDKTNNNIHRKLEHIIDSKIKELLK